MKVMCGQCKFFESLLTLATSVFYFRNNARNVFVVFSYYFWFSLTGLLSRLDQQNFCGSILRTGCASCRQS